MKLHKYKVLKVDLIVSTAHGYSLVYKDITNTLFQEFQMLPFVKHSQDMATASTIVDLQQACMLRKAQAKINPLESASNTQQEQQIGTFSPRSKTDNRQEQSSISILLGLYSNQIVRY